MNHPRLKPFPMCNRLSVRCLTLLSCMTLAATFARMATAATLPVPNASFETPAAPGPPFFAGPLIDYWNETPQPAYYTTNFSTFPWYDMVGQFTNDPGDGAFIVNCDGGQAGFLQSLPQVGIYQDYNSFSTLTQFAPSHAFNAKFQPGKFYSLTAGIIGDNPEGLPPGATLQMSLYYRDVSNNMVTIASTTITNSTNVFPDNLHFLDFSLQTPVVQPTDAWAGQNIGIEFLVTVGLENAGGEWDVDNVRLVESLGVPNASFETPAAPGAPFFAGPEMDYWQETPQPAYYTTNFSTFPWYDMVGEFTNDPGDGAFIYNCTGGQAAFIQSLPQAGIYQDYNSVSITQTNPSHAFNVTYQAGKAYTLSAGIIGDSPEGLPPGATLQMSLYYRDGANNMVTVAATTITNSTNLFPDNLHFVDFSVQTPVVQPTDAWAGQNIGIEFVVTIALQNAGGAWDVDNVRLNESPAPALLVNPVLVNGQGCFGLESPPGSAFNILATSDVTTPGTNWTTIGTITNKTGGLWITDPATNSARRFYRAKQL
jgi:hypothetical protein